MPEQRRSTESRQAELTDAALHIIATRGITALSTRSLAEAVGLSSGAIFRHFASIDALLGAVVGRVEGVLEASYPPPGLRGRAGLTHFVDARSTAVGAQLGILRLVLSEQFILALPDAGRERLAACVRKSRAFIEACLREGQGAGEFRDDVDAGALAAIVMGTIQMLAFSKASGDEREADSRRVRAGLFALLSAPAAPAAAGTRER
ncbi:MAG: TetR/AcrR family transcriptional regulator [Myxococcota bacterium]